MLRRRDNSVHGRRILRKGGKEESPQKLIIMGIKIDIYDRTAGGTARHRHFPSRVSSVYVPMRPDKRDRARAYGPGLARYPCGLDE